jgi:hypothetical protein
MSDQTVHIEKLARKARTRPLDPARKEHENDRLTDHPFLLILGLGPIIALVLSVIALISVG